MRKICIILLLLIINKVSGQEDIFTTHYNQFDVEKKKTSYRQYIVRENEVQQVASFFFLFYKEYVSSQDMNSCVFTPSCSVYAMESVKKLGFIEGILNTFDRLTRCHGLGLSYYPVDPHTHKAYDPVVE